MSQKRYNLGIGLPKSDPDAEQQYFIEVIPLTTKAKSVKFGISDEEKRMVVLPKSAAKVQKSEVAKQKGSCVCKEQYAELIWGGKVDCAFRKKVVQICADLWGESRKMKMANGLMAVMNVETNGSFKAHHREEYKIANDDPKDLTIESFHKNKNPKCSRAVGLIQFTQEALEGMGEFHNQRQQTKGLRPAMMH